MNNDGFISLHRSLLDWEWYGNKNVRMLFIHLLMRVNWKNSKWQGVEIERGSIVTSIEKLAKETKMSVQEVRTALNKLKSTGEITCKSTNKFTLINVVNFKKFQDKNYKFNKQTNKQLTNNQQQYNKYNKEINYIYSKAKKFANYSESENPNQDEINRMQKLAKKYGVKNDRCEM